MLKSKFEQDFQAHVPVSFEQEINYFLGICFHNKCDKEGHVEIKMTQTHTLTICANTITCQTIQSTPLNQHIAVTTQSIWYCLKSMMKSPRNATLHNYKLFVGSLNWLSVSTCPDIVTTTSPIAKYCHNPSKGHIDAALCIVKYIKGTKYMKIKFSSQNNTNLQSFINFTLPPHFHKTNSFVSVMPTGAHRTSHTPPCNLLHQNLNCSKLDQCQVLSCGYIGPLCGSINNKHLQLEAQPKLRSTPLMSVQRTFYTS